MAEDTYSITIKTPKDKIDIMVSPGMLIKEVKEKTSEKFKATIEQLVLIYSGKILKDTETLENYQIKGGHIVHLVIKASPKTTQPPSSSENTPAATSTPPSSNTSQPSPNNSNPPPLGLGLMDGMSTGLGSMGSGNFMEMQQQVQREMMSNPELLQQIMENPFVQNMMSNPEILQQLMTNNPQMQQLMERNPEITHMLNNPQLMRQTMELARNPAMLQEMMRNQDRAMSNLESIPGGYNALRRMYTDIQEPMMNAAQDQFGQNPFAALVGDNANGSSGQGDTNTENTEPLPNPWGSASGRTTSAPQTTTSSSKPSTTSPAGGNSSAGSMFNAPAMQNLMQQITDNPSLMQNMMSAPYMQSMMRSMAENPDLANQIFSHNPLFANNPQMREMMPAMLQQMQSPEMQNLFSNPRAMEAMMQIQQGMQTLQTEAPGALPRLSNPFGAVPPQSSSTATSTTTTTPSTNSTPAPSAAQQALLAQMMQTLSTGGSARSQEAPETRYRPQLEQLSAMGFINRDANIRALVSTNGNVNAAIELLLRALN